MTAHRTSGLPRGLAIVLAAAGICLALPAAATELGELRVRSALGEPLDATFTIANAPATGFGARCLTLEAAGVAAPPAPPDTRFLLEQDGADWRVRLRTGAPVNEPALMFRVSVACDGAKPVARDYSLLLDPRGLRTLPGDTLASLAGAIYPTNRAARDAYLRAIRAGNPSVAGLGAQEPIPEATALVLPELHRFSLEHSRSPPPTRRASAAPPPKAPPIREGATARPVSSREKAAPPAATAVAPKPPKPAARGDFVLRLSSPDVDLSRSRGIDESKRAQLRQRLLVLDADDQVAALLAARENLKQLEGRVADLQLKLSVLPPALKQLEGRVAELQLKLSAAPSPVASTAAPTASTAIAADAPPRPEPQAVRQPASPAIQPLPAAVQPLPAAVQPPSAPPRPEPAPVPTPTNIDDGGPWLQWGVAAVAALAIIVGFIAYRRRRKPSVMRAAPPSAIAPRVPDDSTPRLSMPDLDLDLEAAQPSADPGMAAPAATDPGTGLSARGQQALRRRYVEQRFPEIAGGGVSLDDPDSVVKAARLFYEDGAMPHAVELLQYAIEEDPKAMKPWLALFEIFRLEGLAGEFAVLAARFREHHGATENWRKVQCIGREFDAANPLYRDAAFDSLATIGLPSAPGRAAVTFDPLAENWLNAPMDFMSDALAADLRTGLLADAKLTEGDLVPNPMPALKNVEIFIVA